MSRGDLTLIRPGTRHDYGVEPGSEQWELLWTHFHPEPAWQPWLIWPEAAPGLMALTLIDPAALEKIAGRFFDVHLLATGALRHRAVFAMNALEEVLLWCDTQNPRSEQASLDPRVLAAMDFLCRNLDAPVTSETLAAHSGLSPSRLSHLFRQQSRLDPSAVSRAAAPRTRLSASGLHDPSHCGDCGGSRLREPVLFHAPLQAPYGIQPARLPEAGWSEVNESEEVNFSRWLLPRFLSLQGDCI